MSGPVILEHKCAVARRELEHRRTPLRLEHRPGRVRIARLQVDEPRARAGELIFEAIDADAVAIRRHGGERQPRALCREDRTRVARALGNHGGTWLCQRTHREDEPLLPAGDDEHIARIAAVFRGEQPAQFGRACERCHQPGGLVLRDAGGDAAKLLVRQQFGGEVAPREGNVLWRAVPAEAGGPVGVDACRPERLRLPRVVGFGAPLPLRHEGATPRFGAKQTERRELGDCGRHRCGARLELARQLPYPGQSLPRGGTGYPLTQALGDFGSPVIYPHASIR